MEDDFQLSLCLFLSFACWDCSSLLPFMWPPILILSYSSILFPANSLAYYMHKYYLKTQDNKSLGCFCPGRQSFNGKPQLCRPEAVEYLFPTSSQPTTRPSTARAQHPLSSSLSTGASLTRLPNMLQTVPCFIGPTLCCDPLNSRPYRQKPQHALFIR